jgi:tetratricopeptide (TPR) repeat protein
MIFTFYSYKGGVGRSMALANIAELFYQAGLRVLIVDWDLEAPGLEKFFQTNQAEILNSPGIMDMILDYKEHMSGNSIVSDSDELLIKKPEDYAIDIYPNEHEIGRLQLITAGKRSELHLEEYAKNVLSFSWQDFINKWEGEIYFEWVRQKFNEMADVVLIDSRTGISEMAGVCLFQLADVVVMLCSPCNQSIEGTKEMLNFLNTEKSLRSRSLEILVIPSRVEDRAETKQLNNFRDVFIRTFQNCLPTAFPGNPENLWDLKIPHVPYYSFAESVAVREMDDEKYTWSEEMRNAFKKLANALAEISPSPHLFKNPTEYFARNIENEIRDLTKDELSFLFRLIIEFSRGAFDRKYIQDNDIGRYFKKFGDLNILKIEEHKIYFNKNISKLLNTNVLRETIQLLGGIKKFDDEFASQYRTYLASLKIPVESIKDLILPQKYSEEIILLKQANKAKLKSKLIDAGSRAGFNVPGDPFNIKFVLELHHGNEKERSFATAIGICVSVLNDDNIDKAASDALESIEKASTFKEFYISVLQYAGIQSLFLRRFDKSLKYFDRYYELGGNKSWYNLKKGLVYIHLGKNKESEKIFTDVLSSSISSGEKKNEALALYFLGLLDRISGDYDSAIKKYLEAIEIFNKFEDEKKHEGMVLSSLGVVYRSLEDYDHAIRYYNLAIDNFDKINDDYRKACALGRLGSAQRNKGDYESAILNYCESIEIFKHYRDETRQGYVLKELGIVHMVRDQFAEAIECFNKSLQFLSKLTNYSRLDLLRKGQTHYNLGIAHLMQRNNNSAIASLEEALKIFEKLYENELIIFALMGIATSLQIINHFDESLKKYNHALQLAIESKDRLKEALICGKIGILYKSQNDYDGAIEKHITSYKLLNDMDESSRYISYKTGWILGELGESYLKKNKMQQATNNLEKALEIFQKLGDYSKISWIMEGLGQVYAAEQQFEKAMQLYESSLRILKENDSRNKSQTTFDDAEFFVLQGKYNSAIEKYYQSLVITRKQGDLKLEGKIIHRIGEVYRRLEQYDKALKYLDNSKKLLGSIRDRENMGRVLCEIGLVYRDKKDFKKSIRMINGSIKIFRKVNNIFRESWATEHLAAVYLMKQDWTESIKALNHSIALNPKSAFSHLSLALCYRLVKDNERYEREFCIAEKILMKEGVGNYDLACLEAIRGDKKKALSLLENALENELAIRKFFKEDPHFIELKSERKFRDLVMKYTDFSDISIYPWT